MAKKKSRVPNIQAVCNKILKLVEDNQLYLFSNPLEAGYILLRWSNLYGAGRIIYGDEKYGYQCQNNFRYEVEDKIKYVNEDVKDFMCNAYSYTVDLTSSLSDENLQYTERDFKKFSKEWKGATGIENMTLDQHIKKMFHRDDIWRVQKETGEYLLLVTGNGFEWNKNGFLSEKRSSYLFEGCKGMMNRLNPKLEKKLNDILAETGVQTTLRRANQKIERACIASKVQKTTLNMAVLKYKRPKIYKKLTLLREEDSKKYLKEVYKEYEKLYPKTKDVFSIGSSLQCANEFSHWYEMPDNAHISYVKEGIRIAEDILGSTDKEITTEIKKLAEKFLTKWKKK